MARTAGGVALALLYGAVLLALPDLLFLLQAPELMAVLPDARFTVMASDTIGGPAEAEELMVARDIALARLTGARMHFLHLSTAGSVAMVASAKAAGIVIDDAAVTPRYVVGFAAERELPIVWRIALGSLRNKLLYLLPAALGLSVIAPWSGQ